MTHPLFPLSPQAIREMLARAAQKPAPKPQPERA